MADQLPYDKNDPVSIEAYAKRLVGKTLREMTDAPKLADPHQRRGSFGNAMEKYYFKYKPNSDSAPDFPEAGLELKATPVKKVRKHKKDELVAKERLVIGNIDFMSIVNESFEGSHLLYKIPAILLVSYLYEKDKNPLDYIVEAVTVWQIPEEDRAQIEADWNLVVDKVRAGHAEDISGSDTMYLEACTKGATGADRKKQPFSDVEAKPRAWAFKASYMTAVQQSIFSKMESLPRSEDEKNLGLLELVKNRFSNYFGMTEAELRQHFGLSASKNICARITNKILGIGEDSEIEEFAKAGIKPKTMRVKASGMPKEAISFPAFDYFKLAKTSFDESDFFACLQQKYLFVVYREDPAEKDTYRLSDVCFWQMPDADLVEACRCYEQMQKNVLAGKADQSVRASENRCCHVRPHAQNAADVNPQPYGEPVTKKCFWLNQKYLKKELERLLG